MDARWTQDTQDKQAISKECALQWREVSRAQQRSGRDRAEQNGRSKDNIATTTATRARAAVKVAGDIHGIGAT